MMLPNENMQIISTVGAFLCLFAYVGHQLKWIDSRKALFNICNMFGGGILLYVAFHPFQLGFVVMEATWAIISVYGLIKCFKKDRNYDRN